MTAQAQLEPGTPVRIGRGRTTWTVVQLWNTAQGERMVSVIRPDAPWIRTSAQINRVVIA